MLTGIYQLAERSIEIRSLYPEIHRLCRDYRTDRPADFGVQITAADIDSEREKAAREAGIDGQPERQFTDAYLETLAVYRKIAERLPQYDTFLFHGSALAVDGRGYLFTAASGVGKSTHVRLWREMLGARAVMVNDDKPLLRMTATGPLVYGTPWDGKHRLSNNIAVPLQAVCLLERAAENTIRPLDRAMAYPMLVQQAYRPVDPTALGQTLTLLDRLTAAVPLWRLGCNMEREAAEIAYAAMRCSAR